jgi:hypothetical protein
VRHGIELVELKRAEEIRRGKAQPTILEDKDEQGFLVPDSPIPLPT